MNDREARERQLLINALKDLNDSVSRMSMTRDGGTVAVRMPAHEWDLLQFRQTAALAALRGETAVMVRYQRTLAALRQNQEELARLEQEVMEAEHALVKQATS